MFVWWNQKRRNIPDSKVQGANMGPAWVLSAPDGPHEPCYQGCCCGIWQWPTRSYCYSTVRVAVPVEQLIMPAPSPLSNITLRPKQDGRYFTDDVLKCIFLNENVWIPIKISLKPVSNDPINNIPALVQIMAWRRPGDKPLSEPMMVNLLTHIYVTRPQWDITAIWSWSSRDVLLTPYCKHDPTYIAK